MGDLDYFAEIASRLNEPAKEARALVAARLGQKKYRRDFIDRFWKGAFGKNKTATLGMSDRLIELKQKDNPSKPIDYGEARNRFLSAIAAENAIRAERESAYKAIIVADDLNAELKANRETLQGKRKRKSALDLDLSNLQGKINEISYEQNEAEKERGKHKEFKPGILDFIATLSSANREWAQKDRELGKRYDNAYRAAKEILVKRKESLDNLMALDRDLINTQARQERLERELSEADNRLAAIESAGAKWFAGRESTSDYNEREKKFALDRRAVG